LAQDAPTADALAVGPVPVRISEPGGGWAYSNYGYLVLELIVEEVAGEKFGSYLREHVFTPAGMTTASVAPVFGPVLDKPAVAQGYVDDEGQLVRFVPFPDVWWGGLGSGGISASAQDLFRFHAALIDGTLLSRASQERMYREVAEGYAYGWWTSADGQMLWHDGDLADEGFHSWFVRDRGHDVVVVLLANTSTWAERGSFLIDLHATSPGVHGGPPVWLVAFPIGAMAAVGAAWLAVLVGRLRHGTHLLRRPRWWRLALHLLATVMAVVVLAATLQPLTLAPWRLLWMISPFYASLFPVGFVLVAMALIATLAAFVESSDHVIR
jgi:CubicO group peptidase (beta-lactamase class C family)